MKEKKRNASYPFTHIDNGFFRNLDLNVILKNSYISWCGADKASLNITDRFDHPLKVQFDLQIRFQLTTHVDRGKISVKTE